MGKDREERFGQLVELALGAGAKAAKVISTRMVVVDERVRLKCEIPRCAKYNQYLTCPPHVMSVATFSKILAQYKWCLLVQVEAEEIDSSDKCTGRIAGSVLKENLRRHYPLNVWGAVFSNDLNFALSQGSGSQRVFLGNRSTRVRVKSSIAGPN
jgi:predicted metal-binding protein